MQALGYRPMPKPTAKGVDCCRRLSAGRDRMSREENALLTKRMLTQGAMVS